MDIFLGVFIPKAVVNDLDSAIIFSLLVIISLDVPDLIVLIEFCSIVSLTSTFLLTICSI